MAKKGYTIEEVKKAKIELEKQMLTLAKDFEKTYGVRVSYIGIDRKRDEDMAPKVSNEKPGPIVDVSVNMDLDLVY